MTHGLSQWLYCLCRTEDAGKECRDGVDCEGQCLLRNLRKEVVDQGPPERGYFIGSCSEFVTALGCERRISRGAKVRGPIDLAEPPLIVCAD